MDWEPEIPGQFETPHRISRKRTAPDTGFSDEIAGSHNVTPISIQPVIAAGSYLVPILSGIIITFRIFHQLCTATARSARTTVQKILGDNGSKRVVEIRQLTADGNESVKRRTTESGIARPVAPKIPQISHSKYQTIPRKGPRKLRQQPPKPNMASPFGSSSVQGPTPQNQYPANKEAMKPQAEYNKPAVDREALGARLVASFTPRPLPGLEERKYTMRSAASTSNTVSAIQSNENPGSISGSECQETSRTVNGTRNFTNSHNAVSQQRLHNSQMRRSSLPSMHTSNNSLPKSNESSRSLRTRRSQPSYLINPAEEPFAQSIMNSKTPKQVRFAINPSNGQPFGTSKRFYRESIVGEWAPSSPWSEEQARETMSDLNAHLESLEAGLPWSLPPSTPVSGTHSLQDTPIEVVEDLNDSAELTDVVQPSAVKFSEIVIEGLPSKPKIGETREDGSSSQNFSLLKSSASTNSTPVPKASPYLRIKELWKGSVRQIFFATSPSPEPSNAIDDQIVVQEAIDTSIEMTDAPSLPYTSQNLLSLDELSNANRPIKIEPEIGHGNDGSQKLDKSIEDSKTILVEKNENIYKQNAGRSAAPEDSSIPIKKAANGSDLFLELAMSELRMSGTMKDKIGRRRREREAKEAAERAATEKAKAEAEEAARRVRSGRRLPKHKLVQPLSKAWAARIEDTLRKGDHVALSTTLTGTELKRKDFMTVLGEREWLNDEIINAYLEWIVEYANEKAGRNGRNSIPKVIGLNSFFYKNLSTKGPNSISRWMTRKRAGGKKLLEVETVLIPVNNANHWTIIVVSPKERTIEYLDSFAGSPKIFVNHTKAWLAAELSSAWKEDEWRVLDTKSTEQLNGYDCGVFTITNAECVTGGIVTDSYDTNDMAAQRRRIAGVLLNRGFGGEFIPAEEL